MTTLADLRTRSALRSNGRASHLRELDWLMLVTVALCCLGLVMAVSVIGARIEDGPLVAMRSQGGKLLAGLAAFLVAALTPMRYVRRAAVPLFLVATACCFLVPLVSPEVKGAHRWIRVGTMQFQPVEPARFFMILAIAWQLARSGGRIGTFLSGFLPVISGSGLLVVGLLIQPDHGNAILVLALATCLALVAGVRFLHFLPFGILGAIALGWAAVQHDYVRGRLTDFLATRPDSQVGLGLLAVGSGGVTGRGLGQGWMKMNYVPEAHNDFVFAIVAEELGFLGSVFVLASFAGFGYIGYRLVCRVRDPFLRYVVCGYTLMICLQAAVNLLVVSGWAPAKGIDLPFVSTGGTSLMFCLAAVGLIGNAARTDLAGSPSALEETA